MTSIHDPEKKPQGGPGVVKLKAQFSTVPASIYSNPHLGMIEIAVYGFLDQWRTSSYPRVSTIRNALCRKEKPADGNKKPIVTKKNVSESSVCEAIKNLETFGYVMKIRRGVKRTNVYVLDETGSLSEDSRASVILSLQKAYPELNVPDLPLSDSHNRDSQNCDPHNRDSHDRDSHDYGRDSEDNTYSEDSNYSEKTTSANAAVAPPASSTKSDQPKKRIEPKNLTEDQVENLCKGMADHFELVHGKRPKQTGWFDDMRKLTDLGPTSWADPEPVSFEQVAKVIRWLATNDFWAKNVTCPSKLRKQWDKLNAEMAVCLDARSGSKPSEPVLSGGYASDDLEDAWRTVSARPGHNQADDPNARRPKPDYVQPLEPFTPTKTREEIRAMLGREPATS